MLFTINLQPHQKSLYLFMSKKERIIQGIVDVVNKNAPDSEVYLYGSQARGSANDLSDWDLLILLNRSNIPFEIETRFMDEFYDLELETGEIISPMIYSKKNWDSSHATKPLFEAVKKEGIRIK